MIDRNLAKEFIGRIQSMPVSFENQEKRNRWCCDWWSIEVLKCLYWGVDVYRLDPLPNRLKNNPGFCGREEIVTYAGRKIKTAENLEKVKDLADTLYVCEVGRGLDILVALSVKSWKRIICYDTNQYYLDMINAHFPGQPIEPFLANSGNMDFKKIEDQVILIADNHRIGEEGIKDILDNPNIKSAIIEGELRK